VSQAVVLFGLRVWSFTCRVLIVAVVGEIVASVTLKLKICCQTVLSWMVNRYSVRGWRGRGVPMVELGSWTVA